ncbi:hypothetical protein SFR_0073 [Streptomyces sp. FR-008]|nr:hypothetical protein SFR_0073 [Streptomyces sp. FR-008]
MPAVGPDQNVERIPSLEQVRDVGVDPVALVHHRRERVLRDVQVTRDVHTRQHGRDHRAGHPRVEQLPDE